MISSATMNVEAFSTYFDDAAIFNIPGRTLCGNFIYQSSGGRLLGRCSSIGPPDARLSATRGHPRVPDGQEETEAAVENLLERTGLGADSAEHELELDLVEVMAPRVARRRRRGRRRVYES